MSKTIKILGLDNGYRFTKTSEKISLGSTIINDTDEVNEVVQCYINDNHYIVGEPNGLYISDSDKLQNKDNIENLKVCSLTTIGMSYPKSSFIDVNLVVGVPVAYFKKQKDEFKKIIHSFSDTIKINQVGKKQTININDVMVLPQSAGIVLVDAEKNKHLTSLIIDIGGGTWDISRFDGLTMVDSDTKKKGMIVLDTILANYLNKNYYTNFHHSEIYNLMQKGFFTTNGVKEDISVLDSVINDYVKKITDDIKRQFNPESIDNVKIIGGGASILYDYIVKFIPNAEKTKESQFSNAISFAKLGEVKWK